MNLRTRARLISLIDTAYEIADRYLSRWVDPLTRYEAHFKARQLQFQQTNRYLDIGAGNGIFTSLILRYSNARPRLCVLLDNNLEDLRKAKNLGFHCVAGDVEMLPFRAGAFHRVSAFQLLEHLADCNTFFKEISWILSKGGLLLIICPHLPVFSRYSRDFFPLLRSRWLQKISRKWPLSLFKASRLPQGMKGYEKWLKEVGHVREGLGLPDFKRFQRPGLRLYSFETAGRTRVYYAYCDSFNFSFPHSWKVLFAPCLWLIAWLDRIHRKEGVLSKCLFLYPLRNVSGANAVAVYERYDELITRESRISRKKLQNHLLNLG